MPSPMVPARGTWGWISSIRDSIWEKDYVTVPTKSAADPGVPAHEVPALVESLRREMRDAARELEFELAAELRDRIQALEAERLRLRVMTTNSLRHQLYAFRMWEDGFISDEH